MKLNSKNLGILAAGAYIATIGIIAHLDHRKGPEQLLGCETLNFPQEKMELFREEFQDRVGLVYISKKGDDYISRVYLVSKETSETLNCYQNHNSSNCIFLGRQFDNNGDGTLDWGLSGTQTPLNVRKDIYPRVEEVLQKYISNEN